MKNFEYRLIIANGTLSILKEKRENAMTEGDWYEYNERIQKLEIYISELEEEAH